MNKLYGIYYKGLIGNDKDGIHYIDTDFFNKKAYKTEIQSFLNDKTIFFHKYRIYNNKIFKDVKQLFLHRIITGDFTIDSTFQFDFLGQYLGFVANSVYYQDTLYLYRDKIFDLNELEELHNIFSKYKEEKDYIIYETMLFKNIKIANETIEKIKEYENATDNYYISEYNL